jgi:acetylornithine/N-succinyldiaminopimelate aminotransferase
MTAGAHGSTFGGNPLAMAVAETVLDLLLEEGTLPHVVDMGNRLAAELSRLVPLYPTVVSEWRGVGLMLGIKCVVPNTQVVAALRANGLLTVGAGDNVVRLLPPLIIEPQHIAEAVDIMNRTFGELAAAQ